MEANDAPAGSVHPAYANYDDRGRPQAAQKPLTMRVFHPLVALAAIIVSGLLAGEAIVAASQS